MPTRPLIEWPEPIFNVLEFLGAFLAIGAIGFRYIVVRGARRLARGGNGEFAVLDRSARQAAGIGLIGVVLGLQHVATGVMRNAARQHTSVGRLLTAWNPTSVWILLTAIAIVGLLLALGGRDAGWRLAAIGVVLGTLRMALFGQWSRLVAPIHILAGGLWLGTLFVMVTAGLATVLRQIEARDQRGAIAADMVNAFSPVALTMGALLALAGLYLAFNHLETFDQLWTTPYGKALVVKLVVVAGVFGLGALNWRRMKPKLGSETAARALVRTASGELLLALLVILITAVLTSLPSPPKPV